MRGGGDDAAAALPAPTSTEQQRGRSKEPITPSPKECRRLRDQLRWSREQLALASGLTKRTVADFESGARTPHPRTLIAIRRAFRQAGAPVAAPIGLEDFR